MTKKIIIVAVLLLASLAVGLAGARGHAIRTGDREPVTTSAR